MTTSHGKACWVVVPPVWPHCPHLSRMGTETLLVSVCPWAARVHLRPWKQKLGPSELRFTLQHLACCPVPLGFSSLGGLRGYSAAQCGRRWGIRQNMLPPLSPFTFLFYVKDKGREPPQMEDHRPGLPKTHSSFRDWNIYLQDLSYYLLSLFYF